MKRLNPLDLMEWEECGHCGGKGHVRHIDGAKLRRARESAGLSLRSVAESAGLSASFVSDVELGRRRISMSTLDRYLDAIAKGGAQ